jgi:hypothetical protein
MDALDNPNPNAVKKRKGAPGEVLNEERLPADPTDEGAGTLRGERMFDRCLHPPPTLQRKQLTNVLLALFFSFLSSVLYSWWKACT